MVIRIFLKRFFIFSIPLLLLLLFVEGFYRFVPNDYSEKHKIIPNKYNTVETIIFGNSHPFYGLNPIYFDTPTYNMAHISQTLFFDKILFDTYIDNFKNVNCVILHIEYTSLSEIVNTDENNWRKYYYQSYMDLNVPSINKYDFTKYFLSSTRSFNANIKLIKRFLRQKTIVNCDENGFGINYTKATSTTILKSDALIRVKAIEDNLIDFKDNTQRIQSIIDKCKSKKIKVILLTMPVTNFFSDNINKNKYFKIISTCNNFVKENKNVHYLNLFTDKRFTNDDFFDADHLHSTGAIKSSKIVNDFINTIE